MEQTLGIIVSIDPCFFLNIYKLANIFQSEYLVILDADTMCQYASFSIAPSTSTSRSWEIKVTQYACGNEDKAGS